MAVWHIVNCVICVGEEATNVMERWFEWGDSKAALGTRLPRWIRVIGNAKSTMGGAVDTLEILPGKRGRAVMDAVEISEELIGNQGGQPPCG